MQIKIGDELTTKDLQQFFNVSKDNWKKQKDKFLKKFGECFEYEVNYKGRGYTYKINSIISEYQEDVRKRKDQIYEDGIIEIIQDDNIQTAANVARILEKDNEDIKKLNYTKETNYEYTRVRMRNMFGVKVYQGGEKGMIINKVWCRLIPEYNYYEEMGEKELQVFFDLYSHYKDKAKEEELEIFSDYQNGLITKGQMERMIGETGFAAYQAARKDFKDKFNYYPIKVPVYALTAINEPDEN